VGYELPFSNSVGLRYLAIVQIRKLPIRRLVPSPRTNRASMLVMFSFQALTITITILARAICIALTPYVCRGGAMARNERP
jgi:hypothetical protein